VVVACIHVGAHLAVDDDLGADIARRFQQHRVHVGVRRDAGRHRLQRLRATDFAAVGGDRAVQRHVLRLEAAPL
jgi:hypothetical protein